MTQRRRVYSSGPAGAWSEREESPGEGAGTPSRDLPAGRHALRIRLERSGRRGKQVTVVGPLVLTPVTARDLLGTLKKRCGSGGTLKPAESPAGEPAFELEIQGDHAERLRGALTELGFPAKRAGG